MAVSTRVYLDHNATTPLDPRVVEAMLPYLGGRCGNPSSLHREGREARVALDTARQRVASLVGVEPSQVIFTSGGTEANNLALKGITLPQNGKRLAIGATEHASVHLAAEFLQQQRWQLDILKVDATGSIDRSVLSSLAPQLGLCSVMWANNETGVIAEPSLIGELMRETGGIFHTDAVQALGKIAVDFSASGAHLLSMSGHKIGGPMGSGALIVDKGLTLSPLLLGGGQERGRRGGTENLAAIVGFGLAAELAQQELGERHRQLLGLRQRFESAVAEQLPEAVIFAATAERLPNTVFMAIPGIEGETLITALDRDGFAVANGSACGSHHDEPSQVLMAMGVDTDLARCAIRISFGTTNSDSEIDRLIVALRHQVTLLKSLAAMSWA